MANALKGKKVAMLVANGFEQVELTEPKKALEEAGVKVSIVSPELRKVKGWKYTEWGDEFNVDVPLSDAKADEFDALVLPGGVLNPDKLRRNEWALQFVRAFAESGKPIGSHLPRTVDADRRRHRARTKNDFLSVDSDRSEKCWRQLGG